MKLPQPFHRRPIARRPSKTGMAICLSLAGLVSLATPLAANAANPASASGGTNAAFADPEKVLRTIFPVAETGFDPAATRDLYSNAINEAIFERLFTYDYLASPAKIIPETADGMPEISADGKTYTIKLKKGIYFAPDAAFEGKKRELTVDDYVYSFKRIMDPKIASTHVWLLEDKIAGLDQLAAEAKKSGKFDYSAKVPGLEVVDK
jgi:ABC-type transport system substrate-binding protein